MILLIDNYDSFTHNLAQSISDEQEMLILRNDDPQIIAEAEKAAAIIISPGPGTPAETGFTKKIIQRFYKEKPILGICLGHQTIGELFGGTVTSASEIRHGKASMIQQKNSRLFEDLPLEFPVMRYHSLVVDKTTIPDDFNITATALDDGEVMAIEHQEYPLFGIQFHPESIGTPDGLAMMQKFIQVMEEKAYEHSF
ncbi:anthranilate synthase component II [Enterococcus sp. LJL99]